METLRKAIVSTFGLGEPSLKNDLVLWNGLDQLEKENTVKFYAGKSWLKILTHLYSLKDDTVF